MRYGRHKLAMAVLGEEVEVGDEDQRSKISEKKDKWPVHLVAVPL